MYSEWNKYVCRLEAFLSSYCSVAKTTDQKAAPRRRPKQGGYARGDETRAQIIDTALHIFGDRGFDQASTRDIAAKAGVNPPALQYYFGSKEGLHRACAQYIIDQAWPKLRPAIERADAAAREANNAAALEALENLLDALTDSLADPGTARWSRFIARGKHDGAGPGVELIREQLSQRLINAVSGLLGVILGISATNEMARLRTLLVLGQIHWLHAGREDVLRVMGWPKLDAVKVAMIKKTVREHTRLALEGFLDLEGARRT
jgi:TetR/AcrR family transcriptional regulator, regulator of cefoperazone and chloramphenicol sensitivity